MTISFDPRTGASLAEVPDTPAAEVQHTLRAAEQAARLLPSTAPAVRRLWLDAVADALETHAEELADLADAETALGLERLKGEVARAAGQLRFYGQVAEEGSYLGVAVDRAATGEASLVRVNHPVGPVAVFGASNFPFAFGVLGNDAGSALAAGCPVVVKAHPAHPQLSQRLAAITGAALDQAGAPEGTFGVVHGHQAGIELVKSVHVEAVAFTGSQAGGMALWRIANERSTPIPVFAEMGTVNPVVVTRGAARRRSVEIAEGFVSSFTLGSGQFCTKPGLLFAPAGHDMSERVGVALRDARLAPVMLTRAIADGVVAGAAALVQAGAETVAEVGTANAGWSAPAKVLRAPIDAICQGSRLLDECFGALAIVVEYGTDHELDQALDALQPALAASVFTDGDSDQDGCRLIGLLAGQVGRVAVNAWPTGVAYSWAQQHGGPWPSTSAPATTSVGAAALSRFMRPVAYQSAPDSWLPEAAQHANPWHVPHRLNGVLVGSSG